MKRFMGLFLVLVGVCFAQSTADAAEPIHTSQTRFRIPYQFDPNEMARIGATEIRLYGSEDRGKTWKQLQSVPPRKGKFDFKTQKDGEYWFAVKTANQQGRLFPATPVIEPGLKVIVDTTSPTIELTSKKNANGRIELSWKIMDANVDLSSFGLEYRRSGEKKWQTMIVAPALEGSTTWTVANTGTIEVRAHVQDLADNDLTEVIEIDAMTATPVKAEDKQPFAPDFTQPIANDPPSVVAKPEEANGHGNESTADASTPGNWTASPASEPGLADLKQSVQSPRASAESKSNLMTIKQVPISSAQKPVINPGRSRSPKADAATGKLVSQTAAKSRTVRSNNFQITYELDEIGPSGIGAVELYISPNGGAQWWKYGNDADKKSPVHVRVPEDGEYSFIIRAVNGVGYGAPQPQAGDLPTTIVVVDRSAPEIRMSPIQQGQGRDANRLTFQWDITDNMLQERPVSLFYAAEANGPWKPISAGLKNTGFHEWTVPAEAASELYFKIEAVDRAGNKSFQHTATPLMIDLATPTARVLGIESSSPQ